MSLDYQGGRGGFGQKGGGGRGGTVHKGPATMSLRKSSSLVFTEHRTFLLTCRTYPIRFWIFFYDIGYSNQMCFFVGQK